MKSLSAWLLLCLPLPGQLSRVAVTADSSRIYFISTLRPKGSGLEFRSRAFVRDTSGFSVAVEEDREVDRIGVSPDGGTVYYRTSEPAPETVIRGPGGEFRFPGTAVVSRNGRFVIAGRWIDTWTGEARTLPPSYTPAGAYSLSDTGSAILSGPGGLSLWKDDTLTPTRAPGSELPMMSPDGTWLVARQRRLEPIPRLFLRFRFVCDYSVTNLGTMLSESLRADGGCDGGGAISDRWFAGPDWTRALDRTGITMPLGTAAGDIAFAADPPAFLLLSASGSLSRISIASGARDSILAAPPAIRYVLAPIVPGSPARITFFSPADASTASLSLNGQPLITAPGPDPASVDALIPLDTPADRPAALELAASSDSEFEQPPFPIRLTDWAPSWAESPRDSPAGQTLDLFLHGLGAVSNPPPYGSLADDTLPSPILHPIGVSLRDNTGEIPLDLVHAGLAPGRAGTYLVRVRLPQELSGVFYLTIGPPGPFGEPLRWVIRLRS